MCLSQRTRRCCPWRLPSSLVCRTPCPPHMSLSTTRTLCTPFQMRRLALLSTVAAFKPLPVPLGYLAEQAGLEGEEQVRVCVLGVG